jgi:hypothetical protein
LPKTTTAYAGLVILALAVLFNTPALKADTILIAVNPQATYLLTNQDTNARDSPAINLSSLGIQDGENISLQALGSWCPSISTVTGTCMYSQASDGLLAVFSSSSTLLAPTVLNRMAGAISTSNGTPVVTQNTLMGGLFTDIPQDFLVPQASGSNAVTIPQGANYLFVSVNDSFYGDNGDATGLALQITTASEPSGLLMLVMGVLALITVFRYKTVAAKSQS